MSHHVQFRLGPPAQTKHLLFAPNLIRTLQRVANMCSVLNMTSKYTGDTHYLSQQVTWLIVNEVRSTSFRVVSHAQHIIANSVNLLVTWGLPVSFPFHLHTLYIRYGTIQANTAVLCKHVCIVCRYVASPGECYYNTLLRCKAYFSSSSVVSHAFSALCAYSKFRHHPHPLGYLCAKFRFFLHLHFWVRPWRISRTQSIIPTLNHSASIFDAPGTEACASE